MDWNIINELLDSLDKTVNSNAFFIELGIPDGEHEINNIMVQHLRTGNFHYELVKQDIYRGWNHYAEMVFPKQGNIVCMIPRPGNTWNGNENIRYKKISHVYLIELLHDLLTGGRKHFSVGSYEKIKSEKDFQKLIDEFLKELDNEDESWEAFRLDPNFLNQVDDYYSSGYIKLGYFENCGRDLALAFRTEEKIYVLLTNGYG